MINKINRAGLIADRTGLLLRNPEGPMPILDASTGNIVFKNKTSMTKAEKKSCDELLKNLKGLNDIIMVLDDRTGEIVFKNKENITEIDKDSYKKIMDRLAEEGVHPGIEYSVKSKFEYCLGTHRGAGYDGLFTLSDLMELSQELAPLVGKLETKSYARSIADKAKEHAHYNLLMGMGIDPHYYFNPRSLQYRQILKNLEGKGVDLISDDFKAMRYVTAIVLKNIEDEVLNKISSSIKNNPVKFLQELRNLKKSSSYNKYVLDKLIPQAEVWKVMQKNTKLKGFPFEEIWRFCIDIEMQEYGAYIFENEPGYMIATLNALRLALECKELNYSDYVEINRKCGENVLRSFFSGSESLYTKIRDHHESPMGGGVGMVSYGISGFSKMDEEGLQDIKERIAAMGSDSPFAYLIGREVTLRAKPSWVHLREIKFLFAVHEEKISRANNIGARLIAHIWLSRELSLQHHMQDGNGRTAQMVFLSLLANDPELPMMLLDTNPNLDTNGPVAFIIRVLRGMVHFNKFCQDETVPLTFEEIETMTEVSSSEKRLWRYYHPTQEERQAFIDAHPQEELEAELKNLNENADFAEKRVWNYNYHGNIELQRKLAIAHMLYDFKETFRTNPYRAVGIIFFALLGLYLYYG